MKVTSCVRVILHPFTRPNAMNRNIEGGPKPDISGRPAQGVSAGTSALCPWSRSSCRVCSCACPTVWTRPWSRRAWRCPSRAASTWCTWGRCSYPAAAPAGTPTGTWCCLEGAHRVTHRDAHNLSQWREKHTAQGFYYSKMHILNPGVCIYTSVRMCEIQLGSCLSSLTIHWLYTSGRSQSSHQLSQTSFTLSAEAIQPSHH